MVGLRRPQPAPWDPRAAWGRAPRRSQADQRCREPRSAVGLPPSCPASTSPEPASWPRARSLPGPSPAPVPLSPQPSHVASVLPQSHPHLACPLPWASRRAHTVPTAAPSQGQRQDSHVHGHGCMDRTWSLHATLLRPTGTLHSNKCHPPAPAHTHIPPAHLAFVSLHGVGRSRHIHPPMPSSQAPDGHR